MGDTHQRLLEVLRGQGDNYLLPFFWQHGNHTERIPDQIARIRSTGCRALCLESRPHPDFCGDGWWRDLDIILAECEERGMKVWILDDKHFPTGYANGMVNARHPDLRPWVMVERHVDVIGPAPETAVLMTPDSPGEPLLGVFAYKRSGDDEHLTGEPIDLTASARDGYVWWNVPAGVWRIFFVYQSRRGAKDEYIDMLRPESAGIMLEAVYEPHYAHYARYFGNTLAGFFSDEPEFGNTYYGMHRVDKGFYETRIGQDGFALPFAPALLSMMAEEMGSADVRPFLGELWYESEHSPLTRLAYMNAVTRLFRDNFSHQLGDWCRAHGVQYIGHIIEDMNMHARLGHGPGHYFRALDGQDMSGIDIVLHQVVPGMAHYMTSASCACGMADGRFFHYVLGQLAASLAHQNPRMAGKAMCEVFGAYGWGEGVPFMKWLMDFLLVRGVNHFVPHAFSPTYPDPDCPPHFGGEGHDPQLDGFSHLMRVVNQSAHLLSGGRHVAPAAVLYHAEAEWMSPYDTAMLTEVPARALLDAHINYDIVCADVLLSQSSVSEGRLIIGDEDFGALVIPASPCLPAPLLTRLRELADAGLPILFVDRVTDGAPGTAVPLAGLPAAVAEAAGTDFTVDPVAGETALLRVYHTTRGGDHVFMLFNESAEPVEAVLHLPARGSYVRLRLYDEEGVCGASADGSITVSLTAGQSEIYVFTAADDLPAAPAGLRHLLPAPAAAEKVFTLRPTYEISLAHADTLDLPAREPEFKRLCTTDRLFNITGPQGDPHFSGLMRYDFTLDLNEVPAGAVLDLGRVGQTARLTVNGQDAGIRIAAPYAFRVGELLRPGENRLTVTVGNTLVGKQRDGLSFYLQLPPSGLLGDLTLRGEP